MSCRRASAGRLFCVGGEGRHDISMGRARGFPARRDAAGRAPGDCYACVGAPRDWSERGKGDFRLDELPQGECRVIAVRGKGAQGAAGYCSERANGEFRLEGLPQGQRRETALRGAGGRYIVSARGTSEFGLGELPQGERRDTVLRRGQGGGDGEAAGDWSEREKGEVGL